MLRFLQQQFRTLSSFSKSCNALTKTDEKHGDGHAREITACQKQSYFALPQVRACWLWSWPYCDYSKQTWELFSGLMSRFDSGLTVLSKFNVQASSSSTWVPWAWFRTAILFIWSNFHFWELKRGVWDSQVCWGHVTRETFQQSKWRQLPSPRYRELSHHCNLIGSLNFGKFIAFQYESWETHGASWGTCNFPLICTINDIIFLWALVTTSYQNKMETHTLI